jgi:uncharacterized RDD family membrane protein YckC
VTTPPPDTPAVPSAAGDTPGPLAEWADRVIATLIDFVFILGIYIVVWVAGAIVGVVSDVLRVLVQTLGYLAGSVYGLYLGYLEGTRGQSPGKAIQGLKVVKASDGTLVGGGLGVVRRIAHVVDAVICYIGFLFPLWDPKKQTIADKLMETVVLKDQEKRSFGPEIFLP